MAEIPENLKYTKEHEWLKLEDDGIAQIGITHYAQESLGDITFVELPEVGDSYQAGESFGVVESVKAASELYMPVSGEVIEINESLDGAPETVNAEPYAGGWMLRIKMSDADGEAAALLSPSDYSALL